MNPNLLFLQIEIFFDRLQQGEYDHPLPKAMALENLANQAWEEVDLTFPKFVKTQLQRIRRMSVDNT